jgi:hypothetical protein
LLYSPLSATPYGVKLALREAIVKQKMDGCHLERTRWLLKGQGESGKTGWLSMVFPDLLVRCSFIELPLFVYHKIWVLSVDWGAGGRHGTRAQEGCYSRWLPQ